MKNEDNRRSDKKRNTHFGPSSSQDKNVQKNIT